MRKFKYLDKLFPNQVLLLHGKTDIMEKEDILSKFLKNQFHNHDRNLESYGNKKHVFQQAIKKIHPNILRFY